MQLFWSVFGLFSDRSRGTPAGFPRPPGGSPSPSKSPPEGGDPTPKGRGRAAPLSALRAPLRPPWGTPTGFPRLRRPPPPVRSGNEGGKRSAQGVSPEKGLEKKSKWWRRSRPPGRRQWKCGEGRAAGGQGWGQPVGNPPGCPRGVPASVHGPRSAGRSRSDLHISTARGSNSAPSGGLFCPAGLTTSVQEV